MKVYIVIAFHDSGNMHLVGVYASRESAEQAGKNMHCWYNVCEQTVRK